MKNMQTKILEVIERFIMKDKDGESRDFIVNQITPECGTAYIMDSYLIKLSMYYEFYGDYFLFVVFPENVKPSTESMNNHLHLHLHKFIIEYHKGEQVKDLLEYLENLLNDIYHKSRDSEGVKTDNTI